jgi:hypothetical protein
MSNKKQKKVSDEELKTSIELQRAKIKEAELKLKAEQEELRQQRSNERVRRLGEFAAKFNGTLDISNDRKEVEDYYECMLSYGRSAKELVITKIDLNDSDECLVQAFSYGVLRHSNEHWYILPKKDTFNFDQGGEPKFPIEKIIYVKERHYTGNGRFTDDVVESIIKNQERFTDEQLQSLGAKRIKKTTKTITIYGE